ncbi:MAG: hypothetical protein PVG49_06755 [Desulfobacteraceae bacterium]|jgi:hypothetical protein
MRVLRQRTGILLAVGLLALAAVYYLLLVSPAFSEHKRLAHILTKEKSGLAVMKDLQTEWLAFVATREQAEKLLAKRGDDFSLLSFMEGLTRKVGVGDRIAYMKPLSYSSEEQGQQTLVGIEIQLDGLRMKDLVRLLHATEYSGKLLRIHRIKIKANAQEKHRDLKVTLQVQTYTQGA